MSLIRYLINDVVEPLRDLHDIDEELRAVSARTMAKLGELGE